MSGEESKIRDSIEKYGLGTSSRNIELLQSLFHENAVMSGWLGPDMLVGPLQPFLDHIGSTEVSPEYSYEITELWIDGNIATVELREKNLFDMSFINRFQLVKQADGSWIIVAKLFKHA